MTWHYTSKHLLLCLLVLLIPVSAIAGPYKITHFQKGSGIPGDQVYNIFQDAKGYIWMCTENGLVSYNGYAFKTYTTKDGLPDNEVFQVNEDARGRLWLAPFAKEVCYIRKGKVYNKSNDTTLGRIKLNAFPRNLCFDRWGNTWFTDNKGIFCISSSGKVSYTTSIGDDPILIGITPLKTDSSGYLLLVNRGNIYRYSRDHFEKIVHLPVPSLDSIRQRTIFHSSSLFFMEELGWMPLPLFARQYRFGKSIYYNQNELFNTHFFKRLTENKVGLSMVDGFCFKDLHTGKVRERLLQGYNVSYALVVRDSSLWLGTLGQGVFHFSHSFIKSIPLSKKSAAAQFINAGKEGLIYTSEEGMLTQIGYTAGREPKLVSEVLVDPQYKHDCCTYAYQFGDGHWMISIGLKTNLYLTPGKRSPDKHSLWVFCKSTVEEGAERLLMATPSNLLRIDKKGFRILDTLLEDRITAVAKISQTIYAGTLTGLYSTEGRAKMTPCFNNDPRLKGRITALGSDADSILWVANSNVMLSAVCNNRIIATLDRNSGLDCDRISVIKASDSLLWLGTDNGLYAINKQSPFRIVRHLSEHNGLNSNQIKCLDIAGGRVWVGTDKGLNYFEEREAIPVHNQSLFFITAIQNEQDALLPDTNTTTLNGKTLRIDFDVVDHSAINHPRFYYRLNQGQWIELDNNNIYFPTIPYGSFTIALKAASPTWITPKTLQLSFYRPYPVLLRWWFMVPVVLLGLLLLGLLLRLLIARARRKERERLVVQQNLLQLEQLALQGQMNSHFIFNCIAAIRQYYNKGDLQRANRFVDAFSVLVRTAFEMVNQTFTSLDQELKYLEQYLKVEQERFNYSFSFLIHKNMTLAPSRVPVPTMLLQPLVENAVKHGVRSLPDGRGEINIYVTEQQGFINIAIDDNGPGRPTNKGTGQAAWPPPPITSTSVNQKRISILNQLFDHQINMVTTDILDTEGNIAGTRATITYPRNIYELKP